MNEYHIKQIVDCGVLLDGHNKQVDHVRGLRAEDVDTKNPARRAVNEELGNTMAISAGQTGVAVRVGSPAHHIVQALVLGLVFGEADPSDFRICEL